jgi:hypothetical protein
VIASPKVVGVFFSNYDNIAGASAMLTGLPTVTVPDGSNFWSGAVSEYGVGPLTVLPPVTLMQAAPGTESNPDSFISNEISTDPMLANVDSSTIVVLFYPSTTALSGSCSDPSAGADPNGESLGFGGYHQTARTNQGNVPYAIVAECPKYGLANALDMVTVAASHEIIEAATDSSNGLNGLDTSSDSGWALHQLLQGNEENGDMCTENAGFVRPSAAYPYIIQRGWSNKAAMAGNLDPCQPDILPHQPFVGAYPVMPDMVNAGNGGSGAGALIAVGQSKTIEVDCFSFQPTAPFNVAARQSRAINPPELQFAWDKQTCSNGDKVHLTITVASQGMGGVEAFVLYTEIPGATDPQHPIWAGIVAQQ